MYRIDACCLSHFRDNHNNHTEYENHLGLDLFLAENDRLTGEYNMLMNSAEITMNQLIAADAYQKLNEHVYICLVNCRGQHLNDKYKLYVAMHQYLHECSLQICQGDILLHWADIKKNNELLALTFQKFHIPDILYAMGSFEKMLEMKTTLQHHVKK